LNKRILEMKEITKYIFDSYGKAIKNTNVKILDNVELTLNEGEVNVLVGENGAGKSTLMKILGGIIPPDAGKIVLDGEEVSFKDPSDARLHGIGFIHQELNLCTNMDVAQNIFLGREPKKNGLVDKKIMYKESRELLLSLGFDINPKILLRNLSTAQQQIVEIAKALSYKSKILIMDEPTASLSKKEIDMLFKLIKDMKKKGISIIYISHRFEELMEVGDSITVLRDGKYIGALPISEFDYDRVITMMVGRTLSEMYKCTHKVQDEIALEVKKLRLSKGTDPIDIIVRKGEIVGLGGLVGSGRTELAKSIFGARKYSGGEIIYYGRNINKPNPHDLIKNGFAYLSEDRKIEGLILNMSIKENITLASLGKLFKNFIINKRKENQTTNKKIEELNIISKSMFQMVNTMSGGNQQRVVFGKWLTSDPKLLILDEPTRGIDVNAKAEIYKIIDQIANEGVAVLMISSELPELIGMSDRLYIMRNGSIAGEIKEKKDMIQEKILEFTIGTAIKDM
jgi:ABC-type sugar transport system ATPase subunit